MLDAFGIRTEVRAVIATTRPSRSPVTVLLITLAALALAGSACTPSAGPLGTPSTPAPSTDASVVVPTNDATPGTPAPTATAVASTATPTTTPAPTTTETIIVRNYFFLGFTTDYQVGAGGLVPVLRVIPKTQAVGAAALRALFASPTAKEQGAAPGIFTEIPDVTRLLGLTITDGVATVNLSSEFALHQEFGGISDRGRLAQVVYTLTQFPTVTGVFFQLDGVAVTSFRDAGMSLANPLTRADFQALPPTVPALIPSIFMDRPAWGAAAANPVIVSGVANVFEATFRVQLRDANGSLLVDRQVMASCGTGCWGDFSVSIPYTVIKAQWGKVRVFDLSAKDGTPQDSIQYPVWLVPAA
jgi:germination protein M